MRTPEKNDASGGDRRPVKEISLIELDSGQRNGYYLFVKMCCYWK